jgi:hypothetical protein
VVSSIGFGNFDLARLLAALRALVHRAVAIAW